MPKKSKVKLSEEKLKRKSKPSIASQKQSRKARPKSKVKPKVTPKAKKSKTAIASEKQSKVKASEKKRPKKPRVPTPSKGSSGKATKRVLGKAATELKKPVKKPSKGKAKDSVKKQGQKGKKPSKKLGKTPVVKKPVKQREGVPEGFTPFNDLITQNSALDIINDRLEMTKSALPANYASTVRVHAYADGSVDGELYINLSRSKTDEVSADYDLQEAFTFLELGDRYWVAVGARYELKTDDEKYDRFKGMTQVQTNFQRAIQTNIAEVHLVLRNAILPGMRKRFGEDIETFSIYVRLNWNPANEQPKR